MALRKTTVIINNNTSTICPVVSLIIMLNYEVVVLDCPRVKASRGARFESYLGPDVVSLLSMEKELSRYFVFVVHFLFSALLRENRTNGSAQNCSDIAQLRGPPTAQTVRFDLRIFRCRLSRSCDTSFRFFITEAFFPILTTKICQFWVTHWLLGFIL